MAAGVTSAFENLVVDVLEAWEQVRMGHMA